MRPGLSFNVLGQASSEESWLPSFPSAADFRFNYHKLMSLARKQRSGIATVRVKRHVAVVGAGAAGLVAARELWRCGYDVTIIEASNRIGGRLMTRTNPSGEVHAPGVEMGAMRMPFFDAGGDITNNCLFDYFLNSEAAGHGCAPILQPFPNPGAAPHGTGIYLNQGYGPRGDFDEPELISWAPNEYPNDPELKGLAKGAERFETTFQMVTKRYLDADWDIIWSKITAHYTNLTFGDLVVKPAMSPELVDAAVSDPDTFDGNVGGFGMDERQYKLLYTIGIGNGSWGAFYAVAALWFMRCNFFGFSSNLKNVDGLENASSLPYYGKRVPVHGGSIEEVYYRGVQSLAEFLYLVPPSGKSESMHEDEAVRLFINSPVAAVRNLESEDKIELLTAGGHRIGRFDRVVMNVPQWTVDTMIKFEGFSNESFPLRKRGLKGTQRNISSCKVFLEANSAFWETNERVPQVLTSDTYISDVYGLTWENSKGAALLASYTWEDDANKLLSYGYQATLARKVYDKLRDIYWKTAKFDIKDHVNPRKFQIVQWVAEPFYSGCAHLYRNRSQGDNLYDLGFNQHHAHKSGLYFTGENYGVEGGWLEPALRSAVDCVVQMMRHDNAAFVAGFHPNEDYPDWPKVDPSPEVVTTVYQP